jgi:uncharacterized protein (DUF1697 family)
MSVRVMLLRAVNVGGATLPMARLRALAEDLGAKDVSTYIASGNLLANVSGRSDRFDRALEKAIEAEFGFFREVISRSPAELEQALANHPFEVIEPKYSYVSFLAARPTAAALAKAAKVPTGEDRWEIVGDDLHLRYEHGAGRPTMKVEALVRALGVPMTGRNLNTVRKLCELARASA